jgi:hypothetical protein
VRAVETLGAYLETSDYLDTRDFARKATGSATAALKERSDLETSVLIGQIQSTVMDLLRASGMASAMDHSKSRRALRAAARHAYEGEMPPIN